MFASTLYEVEELPPPLTCGATSEMSKHMDFIGQRADKIVVVGFGEMHEGTIAKRVEEYTVSCNECDRDGYYDECGDIICEGCGMVLSGHPATIQTEWSMSDDGMGMGRGLEKMGDQQFTHEPS